jgi:formylglycine-generating enzyme required for sulfatase activity
METNPASVVEIPANRYWIGDDSRVETSPRHLVTIDDPYWVDVRPFTIGLLEEAVTSGALDSWADAQATSERSVDALLRREIDLAEACAAARRSPRMPNLQDFPVCTVPWEAAVLICEKWGARLGTEAEWEIAMHDLAQLSRDNEKSLGWLRKMLTSESERGCISCAGVFGEWTSSPWSERYFGGERSDTGPDRDGRVVVRGRLMSTYVRHAATTNWDEVHPTVFRRVWDDPEMLPNPV